MQENPHIPQRWCQNSQTLQLKYWENPALLFKKASGAALLSTSLWMGNGPSPGKNLCQVFLLEQSSLNIPESCFSARLLNDPISWAPSNHKISEALSSQKTRWSSSFLFCLPRSFHQSSHISRTSHTPGLYCSPSIQTSYFKCSIVIYRYRTLPSSQKGLPRWL